MNVTKRFDLGRCFELHVEWTRPVSSVTPSRLDFRGRSSPGGVKGDLPQCRRRELTIRMSRRDVMPVPSACQTSARDTAVHGANVVEGRRVCKCARHLRFRLSPQDQHTYPDRCCQRSGGPLDLRALDIHGIYVFLFCSFFAFGSGWRYGGVCCETAAMGKPTS